jgi:excisionase family DNA binding protein
MDPVFLTSSQVATLVGVDRKTVIRWSDKGLLPHILLPSGHRRYRRSDVEHILHVFKKPGG